MVYDISYNFNLVDIGTSAAFSYLLLQDISEMVIFIIGSGSLFDPCEAYKSFQEIQ